MRPAALLRLQDIVGVPLMAAAIAGEALADAEFARFRADPANRGAICDVGLWRLSRHPNYFCEFMVWVAVAIIAFDAGAPLTWLALLAPAIMYWTLRYASGVPPLEEHMQRTRPHAFAAYAARTPVFFPGLLTWLARRAATGERRGRYASARRYAAASAAHRHGRARFLSMTAKREKGSRDPPRPERLDRLHDAAQLREALEAADEGIAGVHALQAIVAEQVAVVGAHRDFCVGSALRAAALFLGHQRRDERHQVRIAAEVIGLEERAVRLALDVAQMDEMHAGPELARHGDKIVRRVRAERAGAERKPAGRRRHGGEELAHVVGGREHPRQAEDRKGRVVRMDGEPRPLLFRDSAISRTKAMRFARISSTPTSA